MVDGARMRMWAMQGVATKTRAHLAVGATVASMLIAGLGSAAGLVAGDRMAHGFLGRLPPWALAALCACGAAGMASILAPIFCPPSAPKIATVLMIGNEGLARDGEAMDWEKLARWAGMDGDETHRRIHNLCFLAMKGMASDGRRVARARPTAGTGAWLA